MNVCLVPEGVSSRIIKRVTKGLYGAWRSHELPGIQLLILHSGTQRHSYTVLSETGTATKQNVVLLPEWLLTLSWMTLL